MDNFERGDRAMIAMKAYGYDAKGYNVEEEGVTGVGDVEVDGETISFPHGYPFGDLIADMCHAMRRFDIDPFDQIIAGIEHYGADIVEQAWENDEDWHNMMQHPSNIERATRILDMNGVPSKYHEAILVKVGLLDSEF